MLFPLFLHDFPCKKGIFLDLIQKAGEWRAIIMPTLRARDVKI